MVCYTLLCMGCTTEQPVEENITAPIQKGRIDGILQHQGQQRTYILYIPDSYTGNEVVPLVFNFHGYTSNAETIMTYSGLRQLADTEGFIVVYPQGSLYQGSTHWNVGGWTTGSTVDDVGYTEELIDQLINDYAIDPLKIYSTGMSNGGYMSFLLACQLSDRIAAVASVTGSMTPETYGNCDPQHPTPVLQIHGTADVVVPYEGAYWTSAIEEVLGYWAQYNGCNPTATSELLPDKMTNDGSVVERWVYAEGERRVHVEHLKVIGGGHDWPGSWGNMDIDTATEIWSFLSIYDLNGRIE